MHDLSPAGVDGVQGDLRLAVGRRCEALGRTADVSVWLPHGYEASERRYPVVYFFDGHNLYDPAASAYGAVWHADRALAGRDVIAVGVPCHPRARLEEYSPHFSPRALARFSHDPAMEAATPRGGDYLRFLVDELKPWVDDELRTDPGPEHTAVVGSSAGGVMAAWCWATRPDVFGLAGVMSPAFWLGGAPLREDLAAACRAGARGRLSVDVGGREADPSLSREYVEGTEDFVRMARTNKRAALRYEYVSDAVHHESAWGARLPGVLDFLLPHTVRAQE